MKKNNCKTLPNVAFCSLFPDLERIRRAGSSTSKRPVVAVCPAGPVFTSFPASRLAALFLLPSFRPLSCLLPHQFRFRPSPFASPAPLSSRLSPRGSAFASLLSPHRSAFASGLSPCGPASTIRSPTALLPPPSSLPFAPAPCKPSLHIVLCNT